MLAYQPVNRHYVINGFVAGSRSVIYNGRGAGGSLNIPGIVFFRDGYAPVGIFDLAGSGGRR
jgi:hypothetical protein